jgi:hypothetical protein
MRPEELARQYHDLRALYDSGRMSQDDFLSACAELMAEDDAGTWWAVDATGQLLRHDPATQAWLPAEPAAGRGSRAAERVDPKHAAPRGSGTAGGGVSPPSGQSTAGAGAAPVMPPVLPLFDPASLTNIAIVFGASLVISWAGWNLLMAVPVSINALIPTGSCANYTPKTFGMYVCSAFVGLSVVFGSLVLAMAMILLRKPITALINKLNAAVPQKYRSVMPAIAAAVFFAVVWSGSHYATGSSVGIVSHRAFPALVGVLVHLTIYYGPAFMARFPGVFDARDRLPKLTRWLVMFFVPTGLSLLLTFQERVSNEAFKQQFVVIVGMLVAYVILTPRPTAGVAAQGGAR